MSSDRSAPRVGAPSISRGGRQATGHQSCFPGGSLTTVPPFGYLESVAVTTYVSRWFGALHLVTGSRPNAEAIETDGILSDHR